MEFKLVWENEMSLLNDVKYTLKIFPTASALNSAAAQWIITLAGKAISERGKFILSLSGGKTPLELYLSLSKPPLMNQIDWKKVFVFWSDERCVSLDDARNNAHQALSLFLDKIDIPESNIYRIPVNLPPAEAASVYEYKLAKFFDANPPRFDLILLGLGENGHTASLFPGTRTVEEKTKGIRDIYIKEEEMFRITMTAPFINQSRHILFLVLGNEKAIILAKVLKGPYQPQKYPAQLIRPVDGELTWFVDEQAASHLNG